MYYSRIENNIIKGFYSQKTYNEDELNFSFIVIDEELQIYIKTKNLFYINEANFINLYSETEHPILTIKDKELFEEYVDLKNNK